MRILEFLQAFVTTINDFPLFFSVSTYLLRMPLYINGQDCLVFFFLHEHGPHRIPKLTIKD